MQDSGTFLTKAKLEVMITHTCAMIEEEEERIAKRQSRKRKLEEKAAALHALADAAGGVVRHAGARGAAGADGAEGRGAQQGLRRT